MTCGGRLVAGRAPVICWLWALLALRGAAVRAEAERDLSQPLSLAQCIALAEQSPQVVWSQRAQQLEAQAGLEQARTPANPQVSYVAQDLGLHSASGPQLLHQAMIGFAPLAALLRLPEARAAGALQEQGLAAAQEELRQLRAVVGRAFYDLLLRGQEQHAEAGAVQLAAQLLTDAQTRKQHGDASGLEVLRAQAEWLEARRRLEVSAGQLRLAQQAFAVLLGITPPRPITLRSEDPATLEQLPPRLAAELAELPAEDRERQSQALVRLAWRERPELAQAAAERRQAQEQSRLALLRALPLADAQLAVGLRSSALGVGGVVALSGSLPLWDFNLGARHRAQAQGLRAQARQLDREQQIALEVESSFAEYHQARELYRSYALPLAQLRAAALATVRRQYVEGLVPLSDVVQAGRDLLSAQRVQYQSERDALAARWRLVVATRAW